MINKEFQLSDQDISNFKNQGFLLLKGFYSLDFIEYIKGTIGDYISEPTDKYQNGFSRLAFDMYDGDEKVIELLSDLNFRKFIKTLTKKDMIFAQALSFELEKLKNKGFPWHIGTQSFGYHHAKDFGCTIWAPLVLINPKGQRGGMAYVPKDIVNGEYLYSHIDPSVFRMLNEKIKQGKEVLVDDFVEWRDGPLNNSAQKAILDHFAIEDEFELGDALIFDKYVIHRSVMLEDGELSSRAAFVMRFFCDQSTYDKKRAEDLEIPRNYFKYSWPTKFHMLVGKQKGELLADSPLFWGQEYRKLKM